MGKRHLYESQHPIDEHPFEALCCGSWQTVKNIEIRDGVMTLHFLDSKFELKDRGPISNFRIKSRKATLSDCTCLLRPNVEVCVLVNPSKTSSSEVSEEPVWLDARIRSIKRKPHETRCECEFYVNFFENQVPLGCEKGRVSKETNLVEIGQIRILQRLERHPCENDYYRWCNSEDCSIVQKTKLFLKKFLSEISWMLVTSVLKRISFLVRSFQNKIVYHLLEGKYQRESLRYDDIVSFINFKVENDMLTPIVIPLAVSEFYSERSICEVKSSSEEPLTDQINLRRSKRRLVQPERFLGHDLSDTDMGPIRIGTQKICKWKDEALPLALPNEDGTYNDVSKRHPEEGFEVDMLGISPDTDTPKPKRKKKTRKVKPKVEVTELALVPQSLENDGQPKQTDPTQGGHSGPNGGVNSNFFRNFYPSERQRPKKRKYYDDYECDSRWEHLGRFNRGRRIKYYYMSRKRDYYYGARVHKKRTMSTSGYYDVIKEYMKRIESTLNNEEPPVMDQWRDFHTENFGFGAKQRNEASLSEEENEQEEEEEITETEMLWRELDMAIASENFGPFTAGDPTKQSNETSKHNNCEHQFKLDEEIGLLCRLCGYIVKEIRDITPPFMQLHSSGWFPNSKPEDNTENQQPEEEVAVKFFRDHVSTDTPSSEGNDNVWALIPELRDKLHFHQKKAFEFLWRNIAGSLVPGLMDPSSQNRGGCVISHTPGAGKTFLIIAFLVSYLKLFPGKRPLVLAPKTTLYTWYKEIIKWKVPIPVYQIHNGRTYRMLKQRAIVPSGAPQPGNDVMHVIDCLDKIRKWHSHPSILIMGYTSFLTLTREDSNYPHRKYMCEVLRQSPGILILDEGHNPRSTKSRLRKALMKVQTDLRVLLSGTLFQNNFGEYFNTLCLARPKFVNDVLLELDPKFKRKKQEATKARSLMENRARKFFMENIANKINSTTPNDRIKGLNMLKNITNGFIDVYEGGLADSLPGLQSYTLLMKSTSLQHQILQKLQKEKNQCKRFPLELELLITLAATHPCLIKSAVCANKYCTNEELDEFERHKHDFKQGSKLKFIVSLVNHCLPRKEKILIFCHNIAPINFLLEIFEDVYRWRKGKEVLVLQGDLELFERGRVMDKFEEVGGSSKVLLASITACAEGVSLTAASRVVMLDSEWNPSKTKQAIARAFRPGQQRVVYVYQLLATDTIEEEKYDRTTWKEWVSNMIFSEELIEDPSRWQKEKIEDDVLREIVAEDWASSFHMIMKNEKASKEG
uniref:Uncharacterized protein n=1 Tax=Kalanchoe fedtschenkoi TaxID=63787 RepID=A0A7N0UEX2_KALFE